MKNFIFCEVDFRDPNFNVQNFITVESAIQQVRVFKSNDMFEKNQTLE